ncbi:cupin domain-containing protein [Eremomyces bilateralis CBS 781.70]|uniref:Cupin domain-containing protein n=1 Tax=Eremomyces bilateralis CBS 781.70 TaxID=1392243 RepID=A0A6G1G9T8_9PEZI|nr:cupin domain-containing protein [Eremomyces bilateralis CBS 781.70]KAF1814706.1 cupin domain-containing protein [Eremomyces bilateralis CBS 781.70]
MVQQVADIAYDRTKPAPKIELVYQWPLKNVPNFSVLALRVSFPPGGSSPPHRHGGASVAATIIKGTAYNKMNNDPTRLFSEGEAWYEAPGCHHKTSENASQTEELILLATFVVETKVVDEGGMGALVQVDEEYKDVVIHF